MLGVLRVGHRVRDLVLIPLSGDQGGHRYRPIASFTQT